MDLAAAYDYMGTAYAESRCDAPPAAGRGDLPKALEWYEKSLDVVKAAVGEKHPQAADTMFNIAQVHPELRHAPAVSAIQRLDRPDQDSLVLPNSTPF